jgi:hypothetical protein
MIGASTLYYKSFGTTTTLLRRDNISGKLHMIVMTYKTLFLCIKILEQLPLEVHHFLSTKQYFYGVLIEATPRANLYQIARIIL